MQNRTAYLRRLHHWIANRGVRGLLKEVWYRLGLILRGKPLPGSTNRETGPHPFDQTYGVDTTGLLWGEALGNVKATRDSLYWATGYYGIAPSAFTSALQALDLDWTQFTFIDIGCGKGRAMMLATRFPFRRVLGIELSQALVDIANANLQKFSAPWRSFQGQAEAVAADATSFPVPDGPLVLFLYHPFAGPVMKRFVEHLKSAAVAQPREILLLYANPELASQLEASGDVDRISRRSFPLTEEDTIADRFASREEVFAAYRLRT